MRQKNSGATDGSGSRKIGAVGSVREMPSSSCGGHQQADDDGGLEIIEIDRFRE